MNFNLIDVWRYSRCIISRRLLLPNAQLTITIIALLVSSFSKDHSSALKLYCSSNTYRNIYACESRNLLEVWKTSLPIVPMKIMMSNFEMKNQSWVWLETNQKNTMHSLSFHPKSNYLYLQFLWFQIDVEFTFFSVLTLTIYVFVWSE